MCRDDALDGSGLEGAIGGGVTERCVEIGGVETLAQEQDLARLMPPNSGRSSAHEVEESLRALAHLLEGDAELVEIERAPSRRARVDAGRVDLLAGAPGAQLVPGDVV